MRYIRFLAALVVALSLQAMTAGDAAAQSSTWAWPVRGDFVTRYVNGDDPYAGGQHRGIDIAAAVGTPVVAAVGGRVTFAGVAGSSGLAVTVRSSDGRWDASYLHLSSVAVREGADIDREERLGAVGASGRRSVDQPHLHFGVREAGSRHAYRDPTEFLPPLTSPAPEPPPPADAPASAPEPVPPSAAPAAASPGPAAAAPSGAPLAEPRAGRGSTAGHGLSFESGFGSAGGLAFERGGSTGRSAVAAAVVGAGGARRVDGTRERGRTAADPKPGSLAVPPSRRERGDARASAGPRTTAPAGATPTPAAPRTTDAPAGDGFDVGWLAALVGCLAAALCLGRPEASTRAARRGTARVADWLRPLTGRS